MLSLREYNRNDGGVFLTDDSIRSVLKTIGSALQKMHKKGLCHGMLTPENILLNNSGKIHLSGVRSSKIT